MAQKIVLRCPSLGILRHRSLSSTLLQTICYVSILGVVLAGSICANAQTPQQQYVYASVPVTTTSSEVAAFSKDGATAVLALIGAPLADALQGGPMALDAKGRFLFIVNSNSNSISMFQIDQATGILTEVAGSPFAAGGTENPTGTSISPVCLVTESSGQFLYVGYANGDLEEESTIIEYQIDAITPALVAPAPSTLGGSTGIPAAPLGMVTDPNGVYLYVGLGPNPALGTEASTTNVYPISAQLPSSPTGTAGGDNPHERTIAMDPQGRFFFDGWGPTEGFIESSPISPADGSATPVAAPISLGVGNFPVAMLVDSSGSFLYVQETAGAYVYAIDPTSGALGQPQGPLPGLNFLTAAAAAADPQGPYLYSLQPDGIHGFQIDPRSGLLAPLPGSPFPVGSVEGFGGLVISGAPVQAVSGPVAAIFPSSEDFGDVVVGQSSNTRTVSVTNTGDQPLSLNSIGLFGAQAQDFSVAPNCQMPTVLPSKATCSVSVTFKPMAAGSRKASVTVADNAAGGSQSISVAGTGVPSQPAVTLAPGSVSFPDTMQGATSAAQSVTVTNSGSAVLHVSSVLLGGANPGDFSPPTGCSGTVQVNASCTIGVSFAPLGDGQRTATILVADDAPGSPQSVELSGNGIGPPVARPGVTVAPSAVSFPATGLGTTVGSQTVTVTSAGSAAAQISSIVLGGADPGDFKMTDSCTPPGTYAVHSSCILSLIFTPSATGTRTAVITITDDAPNSPQTVSLTGTANPVLVVGAAAGGSLTATVNAGQTATYNLQLLPGFTGSVSLGCGGAPTAATCTVPPSMKVTNEVGLTFAVTVATTGTGAMLPDSSARRLAPPLLLRVAMTLVFWAMAFLLLRNLRRTPWRVRSYAMIGSGAVAGVVLIVVFVAVGCGGGSSVPVAPPTVVVTPTGTYTISVMPTVTNANGAALPAVAPTELTLIVN
jgi:hypothetical protein